MLSIGHIYLSSAFKNHKPGLRRTLKASTFLLRLFECEQKKMVFYIKSQRRKNKMTIDVLDEIIGNLVYMVQNKRSVLLLINFTKR